MLLGNANTNNNSSLTARSWEQIGRALIKTIPAGPIVPFNITFNNGAGDFYDTYELTIDPNTRAIQVRKDGQVVSWSEVYHCLKNIASVNFLNYQQPTVLEYLRAHAPRNYSDEDLRQMQDFIKEQLTSFTQAQMSALQDTFKQQLSLQEMKANLALTRQRYQYEHALNKQKFNSEVEMRERELSYEAQTLRDHYRRRQLDLDRQEAHIRAMQDDYEEKSAAIEREKKQLEESWAKVQRDSEAAKKSQQQNIGGTPKAQLQNERRALELEKKYVAEQASYNEKKQALIEKERSELEADKINLEVQKATLAAEKEKLENDRQNLEEAFKTPQSASKNTIPRKHTPLQPRTTASGKKIHFVHDGDGSDSNSSNSDSDSVTSYDPTDPLNTLRPAAARHERLDYGTGSATHRSLERELDLEAPFHAMVPSDVKFHSVAAWVPYLTPHNVDVFLLRLHHAYVTGNATGDDLTGRLWRQVSLWTVAVAEQKCSSESLLELGQDLLNQLRLRVEKVKKPNLDTRAIQKFVEAEADPDDVMLKAFQKVPARTIRSERSRAGRKTSSDRHSRSRSPRSPRPPGNGPALYCQYCRRHGHSTAKCWSKNEKRASAS